MRTFWKCVLVLCVAVVWGSDALLAQEVVPSGTTIQLLLLRQKSVQNELKLDDEGAKKVAEFTGKESKAYRKALKLKEEARQAKFEDLEKANKKFLEDNLTAAQRKRLEQIGLQVSGLQHLTRPAAAKALDLTEEQQTKFKGMQKQARKELHEILEGKDREAKNKKLAELRETTDKKIDAVLTDKQKEKVKDLVGEPFKGELLLEDAEEDPKDKSEK